MFFRLVFDSGEFRHLPDKPALLPCRQKRFQLRAATSGQAAII
jgi:hypothetical protein